MNIDQNMPQYKQKIICLGLATLLITGCADSHHNLVKDTLIGAGGGGFLMFYTEDKTRLRRAMHDVGLREIRFKFDFEGSKLLTHS